MDSKILVWLKQLKISFNHKKKIKHYLISRGFLTSKIQTLRNTTEVQLIIFIYLKDDC